MNKDGKTMTLTYDKKTELVNNCPLTSNKMNYKHCTGLSKSCRCKYNKKFSIPDGTIECVFNEVEK